MKTPETEPVPSASELERIALLQQELIEFAKQYEYLCRNPKAFLIVPAVIDLH